MEHKIVLYALGTFCFTILFFQEILGKLKFPISIISWYYFLEEYFFLLTIDFAANSRPPLYHHWSFSPFVFTKIPSRLLISSSWTWEETFLMYGAVPSPFPRVIHLKHRIPLNVDILVIEVISPYFCKISCPILLYELWLSDHLTQWWSHFFPSGPDGQCPVCPWARSHQGSWYGTKASAAGNIQLCGMGQGGSLSTTWPWRRSGVWPVLVGEGGCGLAHVGRGGGSLVPTWSWGKGGWGAPWGKGHGFTTCRCWGGGIVRLPPAVWGLGFAYLVEGRVIVLMATTLLPPNFSPHEEPHGLNLTRGLKADHPWSSLLSIFLACIFPHLRYIDVP